LIVYISLSKRDFLIYLFTTFLLFYLLELSLILKFYQFIWSEII